MGRPKEIKDGVRLSVVLSKEQAAFFRSIKMLDISAASLRLSNVQLGDKILEILPLIHYENSFFLLETALQIIREMPTVNNVEVQEALESIATHKAICLSNKDRGVDEEPQAFNRVVDLTIRVIDSWKNLRFRRYNEENFSAKFALVWLYDHIRRAEEDETYKLNRSFSINP